MASWWNTLLAAFLGGGGGGAAVSYLQLRADRRARRDDRRWLDADVIADLRQLLPDIDPEHRGFNLSPSAEVERARWQDVGERGQRVDRELLRLSAGHPSPKVREAARALSSAIVRSSYATEWHVRDAQAQRDPAPSLASALQAHAEARAMTDNLERAINAAG
jgi:hypothetical protein